MTDNRTNEEIIVDALVYLEPGYTRPGRLLTAESLAAILRAGNRLALPPGEDAVERARDVGMEAIGGESR